MTLVCIFMNEKHFYAHPSVWEILYYELFLLQSGTNILWDASAAFTTQKALHSDFYGEQQPLSEAWTQTPGVPLFPFLAPDSQTWRKNKKGRKGPCNLLFGSWPTANYPRKENPLDGKTGEHRLVVIGFIKLVQSAFLTKEQWQAEVHGVLHPHKHHHHLFAFPEPFPLNETSRSLLIDAISEYQLDRT